MVKLLNRVLENLGFSKEENNYLPKNITTYMQGSIWSEGVEITFDSQQYTLKIVKYHFQGEYSRNNSHNLFTGKVKNIEDFEKVLELVGLK